MATQARDTELDLTKAKRAMEHAIGQYRQALEKALEELEDQVVDAIRQTFINDAITLENRRILVEAFARKYVRQAFELGKGYYLHSI